jgi:hypothetical protein
MSKKTPKLQSRAKVAQSNRLSRVGTTRTLHHRRRGNWQLACASGSFHQQDRGVRPSGSDRPSPRPLPARVERRGPAFCVRCAWVCRSGYGQRANRGTSGSASVHHNACRPAVPRNTWASALGTPEPHRACLSGTPRIHRGARFVRPQRSFRGDRLDQLVPCSSAAACGEA